MFPAPASFLLPITRSFSQLSPAMDMRALKASIFPILFLSPLCFFLTPLTAVGRPMYSKMLKSLSPVMPLPRGSTRFSEMSGSPRGQCFISFTTLNESSKGNCFDNEKWDFVTNCLETKHCLELQGGGPGHAPGEMRTCQHQHCHAGLTSPSLARGLAAVAIVGAAQLAALVVAGEQIPELLVG